METQSTAAKPQAFPVYMHAIPFLPLVLVPLAVALDGASPETAFFAVLIDVATFVMIIATYVVQLNYLRKVLHRNIMIQLVLILSCAAMPVITSLIGDISGSIHYDGTAVPSEYGFDFGIGLLTGFIGLVLVEIGNVFTITTRGAYKALGVVGAILQVIICMLLMGISWFAYIIAYAAHDPSTE